jgi:hypothetical protein
MATTSKAFVARICWGAMAAGSLFATTTGNAVAAPVFSGAGTLTFGAEDITGYYSRTVKYDDDRNLPFEQTRNRFALGLMTGGVRLAFHYFLLPHLSLGGSLGYESAPSSDTYADPPGTWTRDLPTENRLILAPRVGYALMFIPEVGLWFRGGIGYERDKRRLNEGGEDYARNSFGVASLDVFFVWSPLPHFGLLVGPTGDLTFVGGHFEHHPNPAGNRSSDASMHRLAITSGIFGYL